MFKKNFFFHSSDDWCRTTFFSFLLLLLIIHLLKWDEREQQLLFFKNSEGYYFYIYFKSLKNWCNLTMKVDWMQTTPLALWECAEMSQTTDTREEEEEKQENKRINTGGWWYELEVYHTQGRPAYILLMDSPPLPLPSPPSSLIPFSFSLLSIARSVPLTD